MSKPAAIFVAAAMGVTAGCVAVIAAFGLDLSFAGSALAGVAALAFMAVTHLAFLRAAPAEDGRVEEIDRFVNELQSRLETIEARLSTLDGAATERARAVTKPLVEEIAALGGLVSQIAKEVAAHDVAIVRLKALPVVQPPPAPAAAPLPEPAAPRSEPEVRRAPPAAAAPPPAAMKAPEPFDPAEDFAPQAQGTGDLSALVSRALAEGRIEPHLQPIVTLPSRRVAHYEAFARLSEGQNVLPAEEILAAAGPVLPAVDRRMAERCAPIALRVAAKGGGALFVNVAPQTMRDASARGALTALAREQPELAKLIVVELRQSAFRALEQEEAKALEALVALGVRLSLDGAEDLRLEPRELAARGVRFVKTTAARLLDPEAARGAAIHPADLAGLLARHGLDLIATHVEEERTVPELLDMDIRFGQGNLFGAPRPVRPAAPETATPATPAAPARLVPRSLAAR